MTLDRRKAALAWMRPTLALLALLAAIEATPAVRAETYMTVADVPVDVTAKNASAARDKAIADVQSKAFARLVKRLVPRPEDQARLQPTQEQLESFV